MSPCRLERICRPTDTASQRVVETSCSWVQLCSVRNTWYLVLVGVHHKYTNALCISGQCGTCKLTTLPLLIIATKGRNDATGGRSNALTSTRHYSKKKNCHDRKASSNIKREQLQPRLGKNYLILVWNRFSQQRKRQGLFTLSRSRCYLLLHASPSLMPNANANRTTVIKNSTKTTLALSKCGPTSSTPPRPVLPRRAPLPVCPRARHHADYPLVCHRMRTI